MLKDKLLSWLPQLSLQVWILAAGRLLSQIGTGFTMFYAPIFFVNEVELSATAVGIGLGSSSIAGVLGRFLGGTLADNPAWGRRKTLLLSAAVSAVADVFLALTYDLPTFIVGNLLMGMGIGLYWPATEAAVADLTTGEQRNEAFAVTRLADSLGLGLGVILAGEWVARSGNYRALFVVDGISFVVFFAVIYAAISETVQDRPKSTAGQGWGVAFRDRALMVYLLANILFTLYISQIQSTLPLYFTNFATTTRPEVGFLPDTISLLFSFHVVAAALFQLPIARWLNRFRRPQALTLSLILWAVGFGLIWGIGRFAALGPIAAAVALGLLALAIVSYTPSASAFVVDLAPESLRGVYLALNSQCWAIGYLIGPPLGGWALDRSAAIASNFWLFLAASTVLGMLILRILDRMTQDGRDKQG
ncbi:MAG: MFS transporter [Spirulinaceae cyanobacterium]